MTQICLLPSMVFFLLATVAFTGSALWPALHRSTRGILTVAIGLHTAYLCFWFLQTGTPFLMRTSDVLLLLSWVLAVVVWVLGRNDRWQSLGSWLCPVIVLLLVASLYRGGEFSAVREIWPQFWVVPVHLVTATVSAGLFVVALVVGTWLYFQDARLKRRQMTLAAWQTPAIGTLAKVLAGLLMVGWVLLTVVIITGAIMLMMKGAPIWGGGRHWAWAIVAWLLYAAVLHSRLLKHRSARRGILLSLFGFTAIILSFIEAHG